MKNWKKLWYREQEKKKMNTDVTNSYNDMEE